MRMRTYKTYLAAAGLSLITSAALGLSAQASYITTLNSIAGADGISHWNLNETTGAAADSWGAGTLDGDNPGTFSGAGVIRGVAGPSAANGFAGFGSTNNAVQFEGTATQLLEMAETASFAGLQEVTMLMWVNIPSSIAADDDSQRFFGGLHTDDGSGRYGLVFNAHTADSGSGTQNGSIRAYTRVDDGGSEIQAYSELNNIPHNRDGEWHFLALTMHDDGADKLFEVYVDGQLEHAYSLDSASGLGLAARHTSGPDAMLTFGRDTGDDERIFLGAMDELTFIDRGLSGAEIGALYTAAQVPEPSTVVLAGLALAGLAFRRRLSPSGK